MGVSERRVRVERRGKRKVETSRWQSKKGNPRRKRDGEYSTKQSKRIDAMKKKIEEG